MAAFCAQSLQKREKVGDRREGPSKLEAISILARDPCTTQLPFSVPILLPSGDYQVRRCKMHAENRHSKYRPQCARLRGHYVVGPSIRRQFRALGVLVLNGRTS